MQAFIHYSALLYLGKNYFKAGDFANSAELIRKSLSCFVEKSADYILGIVYICFKYCICIINYSAVLPFNVDLALYMLAACLFAQTHFSESLQLCLQVRHIVVQSRETTSEVMAQGENRR